MIDPAEASAKWRAARVLSIRDETAGAKTIAFDIPGWPGHLAGQHLDLRLTAEDGYTAQRSYSIASAAGQGPTVELTVDLVPDGEVSEFLHTELRVGDVIELRGPIGGYFAWSAEHDYGLLLIAGGSGVVPLMSMLRSRRDAGASMPARLLYSSRSAESIIYRAELELLANAAGGPTVTHTLTRSVPAGWEGERGRVDRAMLERNSFGAVGHPDIYVCGPTSFVEAVADILVAMGHSATRVRTERFGPTGELR